MRVLVLAQGHSARWTRPDGTLYLDRPKHLIDVDGETLLARLVRQLRTAGITDLTVIAPADPRYHHAIDNPDVDVVTLEVPYPTGTNLDKLFGTQHLWNPAGRTLLCFADTYYTDNAIRTMLTHPHDDPHWFRRPGPSTTTGHRWDETFAFSFGPTHHPRILQVAHHVANLAQHGALKAAFMRCHYAAMLGLPDQHLGSISRLRDTPHQTVIDDWTDDFDRWDEWCGWMGRHQAGHLNVVVAVPWTGGDTWRTRCWNFVRREYEAMGLQVVTGDDDLHGPTINRSRARNNAITTALERNPDVVFIADADVFVPDHQLWAAATLAHTTRQLTLAFDTFVRTRQAQTDRAVSRDGRPRKTYRPLTATLERGATKHPGHASCAMAITPDLWAATGGYDERFTSWGGEDRSFWLVANALAGTADRIPGPAWHLWHPRTPERKSPERHDMVALAMRYKRAVGYQPAAGILPEHHDDTGGLDLDTLHAILAEPGAPHGPATIPAECPQEVAS